MWNQQGQAEAAEHRRRRAAVGAGGRFTDAHHHLIDPGIGWVRRGGEIDVSIRFAGRRVASAAALLSPTAAVVV